MDNTHPSSISNVVAQALAEDVGPGDLTADLVDAGKSAHASVVAKESATICGQAWFNEVFRQLDTGVEITWHVKEGDYVAPEKNLCDLSGPARALLTGERTAINFLQTLSGTATTTRRFVDRIKGTRAHILDTRKTLPGLRDAQKYAVHCGGGQNHRRGLYDGILIKENHIAAAGSITGAIERARELHPGVPLQVEVEDLNQVREALQALPDLLLLDNFPTHLLSKAVNMAAPYKRTYVTMKRNELLLEASGDINLDNVRTIADTGVDRISIGGLTKHVTAIDLSMRLSL